MDTRFLREHSAKKMSRLLEGELTMPPSAYFDRNCFIGAATTERRELARRNEIGVPNMLWGNDYPHPEGTWPHTANGCAARSGTFQSRRPGKSCAQQQPRCTTLICVLSLPWPTVSARPLRPWAKTMRSVSQSGKRRAKPDATG
jgi:hypothetical protein